MRSILLGLIAFWAACPAQGVGLLYSFQLGPRNPAAGVILGTNGCLYGTSYAGGSNGYGAIFAVYTNGGLSHQFSLDYTNGIYPQAALIQGGDSNYYGTSYQGGENGLGTVFKLTPTGAISNIVSFNGSNPSNTGSYPLGGLVWTNGYLYGTTSAGGPAASGKTAGFGSVFKLHTNGTLTTLTNFNFLNGASPQGSLLLASDSSFYGTTFTGGYTSNGTVFRVTEKGGVTTLTNLHIFDFGDGSGPCGGLVESNGMLYGTTSSGGNAASNGTIFCITMGGEFMSLLAFDNFNGSNPQAGLTVANGLFYGTTYGGGVFGLGTVFAMTADGALTTLAAFDGPSGANPQGVLAADSAGNLYGTTANGGQYGVGTVFRITPQGEFIPLLSLNPGGAFPSTGLVAANSNLYGAISYGGQANSAMVFGLSELGNPQMLVPLNGAYGATPVGTLSFIGGNVVSTNITTNFLQTTNVLHVYSTNFVAIMTNISTNAGDITNMGYATNATIIVTNEMYGYIFTTNTTTNAATAALPTGTVTTDTIFNILATVVEITNTSTTNTLIVFTNSFTSNGTFMEYEYETNITDSSSTVTIVSSSNVVATTIVTISNSPAIYGATFDGGASNLGTVFTVGANGLVTNLVSFAMTNGAHPLGGLMQGSDGNLYGTTSQGGPANMGLVFKVSLTNGGGLTVLAEFANDTNNAGAFPEGPLAQGTNGVFYGTAYAGGLSNQGAIFMLNTNGVLSTLFSFGGTSGINPETGVVIDSEGNLLGTTSAGGSNGDGAVFKFNTDSNLMSTLSLDSLNGQNPQGPLVLGMDGNYYGTAQSGGASNYGTVFSFSSSFRSPLQTVFSFYPAMGIYPNGGLVLGAGSNIYGATSAGGTNGGGTVFCVSSTLAYSVSGNTLTLAWLANSTATNLQATSAMPEPWSAAGAGASASGGWYQLQVPTTNGAKFVRLAPNRK
jgi:uncharacterized repeat protein (TIGR03803 family)